MNKYTVISIISFILEVLALTYILVTLYFWCNLVNDNFLHITPKVRFNAIYDTLVVAPVIFMWTKFIDKFTIKDSLRITWYIFGVVAILNVIIL